MSSPFRRLSLGIIIILFIEQCHFDVTAVTFHCVAVLVLAVLNRTSFALIVSQTQRIQFEITMTL